MIIIKIEDDNNEFGTEQEDIIMEFLELNGFKASIEQE